MGRQTLLIIQTDAKFCQHTFSGCLPSGTTPMRAVTGASIWALQHVYMYKVVYNSPKYHHSCTKTCKMVNAN